MKSLRKLLWIQLFLLSVLVIASILVEIAPESQQTEIVEADEIAHTVSSH